MGCSKLVSVSDVAMPGAGRIRPDSLGASTRCAPAGFAGQVSKPIEMCTLIEIAARLAQAESWVAIASPGGAHQLLQRDKFADFSYNTRCWAKASRRIK